METKGISCKIPQDLHAKITEEIRASGSTMSKFIEMVINSYYDNKEKGANNMGKPKTLAVQVSKELFDKVKAYLDEYERVYGRKLTQKDFVIGLIEQALEEAEEEFEAARAARGEAAQDAALDNGEGADEYEAEPDEGDDPSEIEAEPNESSEPGEAEAEQDEGDEPNESEAEPENDEIPEAGAEPAEDADGMEE